MNNKENLKECGLFHGCNVYIDTSDEVVYQLFLKNYSIAMQRHFGMNTNEDNKENWEEKRKEIYDWIKEFNYSDGEYDTFTDKPHRAYGAVADYFISILSKEIQKAREERDKEWMEALKKMVSLSLRPNKSIHAMQ